MLGFNPYFALAGGLALITAAGGGYLKGEDHAKAKADQAALHQLTNALNDRDAKQKQIDALETAAAVREQNRESIVREVTREIPEVVTRDRVVYDRTCVDAAGVSLLDRARDAANGTAGADPGPATGGSSKPAGNAAHR